MATSAVKVDPGRIEVNDPDTMSGINVDNLAVTDVKFLIASSRFYRVNTRVRKWR